MSGANDRWLRNPLATSLLAAAFMVSLVLGIAFLMINTDSAREDGPLGDATPLTDEQSRDQVVGAAREVVTSAHLRGVTGGYTFLSCRNEQDPPYQAAVYLNFEIPAGDSSKSIGEIQAAMVKSGWHEAPSPGEHFGGKLTRAGVTATFQQNVDDPAFGIMRIYGECRNMADHRNEDPAWTEISDQFG